MLSCHLNRNTQDSLWWWITGVYSMVIHNRISEKKFTEEIGNCNNEVLKL